METPSLTHTYFITSMGKYQEEIYWSAALTAPLFGLAYRRTRCPAALVLQSAAVLVMVVSLTNSIINKLRNRSC